MLKRPITRHDARWKKRFRARSIYWSELARGHRAHGLVLSDLSGQYQLHAWHVKSGELRQLTSQEGGVIFGCLSNDGKQVYYFQDEKGGEVGHFVQVPFNGGEPVDLTPDLPPYASMGVAVGARDRFAVIGLADADGFHAYAIHLQDRAFEPQRLHHADRLMGSPLIAPAEDLVVLHTTEFSRGPRDSLLVFNPRTGETIGRLSEEPEASLEAITFSPVDGDTSILATTDRTGATRPLIWDPLSDERLDLALDDLEGDVKALDWSPDGSRLLLSHFFMATEQLYIYSLRDGTRARLDHPAGSFGYAGGALGNAAYFSSEDEIYAHWQDAANPLQLIALDARTGRKTKTLLGTGPVPRSRNWRGVTFLAQDRQQLQAWLALPAAVEKGPFPTIIHMHGGPDSVMTEMFEPRAQAWLDHGFAFCSVNYRGSTTFGRKFLEQIWGRLGDLEVQDIVAARAWLVEQHVADPAAVFLTGWSYGGYLTLLAHGRYPDLWAGGLAGIAIADWGMSYEDSNDTLKAVQVELLGGTPDEVPEIYRRSSPLTYTERIQSPILIIQGRNDSRTPARPIQIFEERMKALGKPIEVHWFDAGHFGAGIEEDIEHQQLMLDYAFQILNSPVAV